jgi:hypothetical protein
MRSRQTFGSLMGAAACVGGAAASSASAPTLDLDSIPLAAHEAAMRLALPRLDVEESCGRHLGAGEFGIRPSRRKWKAPLPQRQACPRPTAVRRSCRRSPGPWPKVEQRVLVTVEDAICFAKNLGEILASPTLTRGSGSPCSMGRPSRRPTAIEAALRRRRAAASAHCRRTGFRRLGTDGSQTPRRDERDSNSMSLRE